MEGKRTADEAGLGPGTDRPAKSFRIEDFLESMDPSVRIKLRSMFDDRLLQAEDLDERNVAELRKFDAAVALEILEHYSQADFSTVRNRRAYLAGALKRKSHLAIKSQLQPDVEQKLNQLTTAGSIRGGDLDKRCMDTLASLPSHTAITVLERFSAKDFSEVRNPSALFMATVKTVVAQDAAAASAANGGSYGAPSRQRSGDRGHYPSSNGGYNSSTAAAAAAGAPGGPTPRSYPGYPSLGPSGSSYDGYDAPQPPPPPRPQQQYVPAGGLGALGAAAAGPVSADGLPLLPGGGMMQQPGVQLVAPSGLSGVPPGTVIMAAGAGGVQQQYIVTPGGMLTPVPAGATVLGGAPGAGYAVQMPAPAAAAAPAAVPPSGVPPEWAAGRKQYGLEQGQLGVRTSEFHGLSPFASFVHPSPALKLQQLWDDGNELVSMLDDKVWQVLAELPAPEALAVIDDAGQALLNPHAQIRNINAYFMSVVRKVVPGMLPGLPQGQQALPGRGGYTGSSYDSDEYLGGRGGGGRGGFRGGFRGRGRGGLPAGGGRSSSSGYFGGDMDSVGDGGGFRQAAPRAPGIHLLPPAQRAKAEELCRDHAPLLRQEHFDEGVVATLERLPHDDGLAVLDELGGNSMAGVRNLPAYIMGICKRYIRGEAGAGAVAGGRGGGRGGGPPAGFMV